MIKQIDKRILLHINKEQLISPGDRILLGVSGGPDSMLLLHWFHRFRKEWDLSLAVAHLNHQLREEAEEEARYVEAHCAAWDIPCITATREVARFAEERKLSLQVAARQCRYDLFNEAAREMNCTKLALGHHADDQAETVMMNLIRGSGLEGLAGMHVRRRLHPELELIRPLLVLTKEEIEAYCRHFHLEPRRDPSNDHDDYRRNWVRLHLMPQMKTLNPKLPQTIQEMTALVQEEQAYLNQLAKEALERMSPDREPGRIQVVVSALKALPLALQRRVVLLLLSYLLDRQQWQKVHVDAVLHIIQTEAGEQTVHLPGGIVVRRQYGQLFFLDSSQPSVSRKEPEQQAAYCHELLQPGTYHWSGLPFVLKLERFKMGSDDHEQPGPSLENQDRKTSQADGISAIFDAARLEWPLMVRSRKPGDRIQPLGMTGHSKVKNIFINHKLPREMREWWPLVADGDGLIWVPGMVRSERAQVDKETKEAVRMTFYGLKEGSHCWRTSRRY